MRTGCMVWLRYFRYGPVKIGSSGRRVSSLAPQNGQTAEGSLKLMTCGAPSMYSVSRTPTTHRSKMIWRSRSRVEGDKRTGTRPLKRGLRRLDGPNSGTNYRAASGQDSVKGTEEAPAG